MILGTTTIMNEVRLLFVTRNYPPQIGGMERYSYDLYHSLKDELSIDLLKHSTGKLYLPIFFIRCLLFLLINGRSYTHIHFGDAVLSPLAYFAKVLTKAGISITVHALDIIFDNRVYQLIVPRCLVKLDKIVAVSRFTLEQCVRRGIDKDRCFLIPNGINISELVDPVLTLGQVTGKYNIDTSDKKILFSIGRLIKRKGIRWFVERVMPRLGEEYVYLIAGSGPEFEDIAETISAFNLERQVYLLGRISDSEKSCLYLNSALYLMPNISIPGDAEGFGITIIEAAAYGLPAIASNIEGIPDTITAGVTGILVEQGNVEQYIDAITRATFDRDRIRKLTRDKYDWAVLKNEYRRLIFR